MLAKELQPGDELRNDETLFYVVQSVTQTPKLVEAIVRYEPSQGGGLDTRAWYPDDTVPHTRPEA